MVARALRINVLCNGSAMQATRFRLIYLSAVAAAAGAAGVVVVVVVVVVVSEQQLGWGG